jgi:hypothetical protein
MFKVSRELTFPWPVKVIEPDPDKAGALIEREFTVFFALLHPDEAKASAEARTAILKQMTPETGLEELKAIQEQLRLHDLGATRAVIRGWGNDIVGDDDQPLPFTPANLEDLLKYPRVQTAMGTAYKEAISEDKARLGN